MKTIIKLTTLLLITLISASAAGVILTGCTGGNSTADPDNSLTQNTETDEEASGGQHTPGTDGEKYLLYFEDANGNKNRVSEFEHGMAVNPVIKKQPGDTRLYISVINTRGEIIYKLDTGSGPENLADLETIHIGEKIICFKYGNTYYLINSDGKEIYKTDKDTDVILGVGESNALIYQKEADINSAIERIGVIDCSGTWTLPLTSCDDLGLSNYSKNYVIKPGTYSYLGEDYYEAGGLHILNYKTKTVKHLDLPHSMETAAFGEMKNGRMLFYNFPGITYAGPHYTGVYLYDFNKGSSSYVFDEKNSSNVVYEALNGNRVIYRYSANREYVTDPESDMYYRVCVLDDKGEPRFYQYEDYKTASHSYRMGALTFGQGVTGIDYYGENFIVYIHGADDKDYFVVLNDKMEAISSPIVGNNIYSCDDGKVLYWDEDSKMVLIKTDGTMINNNFPKYPDSDYPLGFHDGISCVGYTSHDLLNGKEKKVGTTYINEKGEVIFNELVDRSAE